MNKTEQALVGLWRLQRWETRDDAGHTQMHFGQKPVGVVIYDAAGYMAVQIMESDDGRGPAASASQVIRATARHYIAYCGAYEVDEEASVVSHHVEASINPNWVGSVQQRSLRFDGDELVLSFVDEDGCESALTWRRQDDAI